MTHLSLEAPDERVEEVDDGELDEGGEDVDEAEDDEDVEGGGVAHLRQCCQVWVRLELNRQSLQGYVSWQH